jgi:hypothetical protein
MKVSGVAIGQWNSVCKKKEGRRRTLYKIYRAIVMGTVSHIYPTGDYIVRYYDVNLLVSKKGMVLTVWKDASRPRHIIPTEIKERYDNETTFKDNVGKAKAKHKRVLKRIAKTK